MQQLVAVTVVVVGGTDVVLAAAIEQERHFVPFFHAASSEVRGSDLKGPHYGVGDEMNDKNGNAENATAA